MSAIRVTAYYFYVNDADFGHGFIKICAYFPYPGKVWVLPELRNRRSPLLKTASDEPGV